MSTTETKTVTQPVGDAFQQTQLGIQPSGLRERRASSFRAKRPGALAPLTAGSFSSLEPASQNLGHVSRPEESAIEDDGVEKDGLSKHGAINKTSLRFQHDNVVDNTSIALPPTLIHSDHHFSTAIEPGTSIFGGATPGGVTPTQTRGADTGTGQYFDSVHGRDALVTSRKADRYKIRLVSSFLAFFCAGWADGTPGTILPHLEAYYGLSHFTVSLIFIAGTVGFAIGTIINEPLFISTGKFSAGTTKRRFFPPLSLPFLETRSPIVYGHSISQGRCLTLVLGGLSQVIYFSVAMSRPPFIGLIFAFVFGGISIAIISAQCNAYVADASVRTQGRALGNLHGFYGIGAFASPLVCQTCLAAGWKWHQFYYTSIGFSLASLSLLVFAFHTSPGEFEIEKDKANQYAIAQEKEGGQVEAISTVDGEAIAMDVMSTATQSQAIGSPVQPQRKLQTDGGLPKNTMRAALSHRYVWIFMIFLPFYTGSETTTGGWIVTYLLKERNANPNTVGYVASGFWAGLAAGRIILGYASPYIGIRKEKHLVHVYIATAIVMSFIIWFVPSFVGNAICAAFIGFALGPIFPTSLVLATKILPKEVHLTALSIMSSFASIGSALFPFVAGVIANAKGVSTLQPFMIGILGVMGSLWFLFPSRVGMTV